VTRSYERKKATLRCTASGHAHVVRGVLEIDDVDL